MPWFPHTSGLLSQTFGSVFWKRSLLFHLRLNLSCHMYAGRGQTGGSLRISKMVFLPFGRKIEDVSRVTRILICTSLSLQPQHNGNHSPLSRCHSPGGSEVPGRRNHVCVSLEGDIMRHSGPPAPWPLLRLRTHILFMLLVTDSDDAVSIFT